MTADDFGRSVEINQAVLRAHREGILTGASLMVAGKAADDAVEIARRTPTLAVGLHVVLVDGPAVLSGCDSPILLKNAGCFPDAPVRLGLRYTLHRRARRLMRLELEAQFAKFARSGLRLSHVDSHQHLHLHPAVFPLLVRLAREYQAAGIRLPRDDLRLALRYDSRDALRKIVWAATLGAISRLSARRIPQELRTPQRCYGLFQSGHMQEDYVLQVLRSMKGPSAEIYFHPTIGPRTDALGPNAQDLDTLLSSRVRQVARERGLQFVSYRDLVT